MRRLFMASFAVVAVVAALTSTGAEARRAGTGWHAPAWRGPGIGLQPWGWRGLGWDDYYVYSPAYYGYGCYRPVMFWAAPPVGMAWQYHRVC